MNTPKAGNNTNSLKPVDVVEAAKIETASKGVPTAEDLDAFVKDSQDNSIVEDSDISAEEVLAFDFVTRAEYNDLINRINVFNTRSSQRI